ncbi:caspase family protein [Kovacikia minuta CCNUW1]|uniref:caspase family protein n=1 Tax=Kovacikia minuta TaxID=2931930 RepID=UPI001CC967B6|nr:caspase family protein [Kovacikia minuta]UBF28982.1 caspase family protein [Kovacikia minuta CCNUW1]
MRPFNRRHFLQFAGSTLASLGLSQLDVVHQGVRYAKVLAQGTPRKLALLVGINAYPESSQFSTLQGCVTDVELQRQLLIYRFGFNPADILTLTDAKATRQGILTAFEDHLIKQAKAGDIVVFHYSGHGSQVADPDRDEPDGLNSTFVPVDSTLPEEFPDKGGTVKDIMGHTLFLLMSALQTENVSVVLDSCHSGGGTRGSLRVRSRAGGALLQPDPAELDYQKQWLSRLNLTPEAFIRRRKAGVAKGVVIASAKRDQLAADAPFSDFYAGAFTYLMTQYLWQQTGTTRVNNTLPSIARSTTRVSSSNQEPVYEVKPGSSNDQQPLYFTPPQNIPAEAVITKVDGDRAELWLGGLAPQSLEAFNRNAVLVAIDGRGDRPAQIRLESRQGLVGQGKLLNAVKPGALLQEQIRGIPTGLTLKIGLDPSLGRDLDQAKQALLAIKRIEALSLQQGEVQYILGRMTDSYYQQLQKTSTPNLPAVGSMGLFYPGLDVVPGAFGAVGESGAKAVDRLQAKLKSLLAARIVKLTLNPNSSRLKVAVAMNPGGNDKELIASTVAVRGANPSTLPKAPSSSINGLKALPLGTSIQFRLTNNEPRDLYFSVLVIDSTGEMAVIFPNQWTASAEAMKVAAGQSLRIPEPGKDGFNLVTQEPKGTTEVLVVASSAPLSHALKALQDLASQAGQSRGPVALADPTIVIGSLLDDLNTSSDRGSPIATDNIRSVDVSQLATLSITFEVV